MLSLEDSDWTFKQLRYNDFRFPPTLNVGDYNLDGFPDVVTVLYSPTLVKLSCTICGSQNALHGFAKLRLGL